jgi:hypothetical protein
VWLCCVAIYLFGVQGITTRSQDVLLRPMSNDKRRSHIIL